MFKTEALLAFVQVTKYGSFTAAAQAQGQTPMALSKQVSQLEQRLAEPLFERTTRKVALTEFGQAFLSRAEQVLAEHQHLSQWLESRDGAVVGTLKIVAQGAQTYDETVFPWLGEFHQLYPDLKLSFDVVEDVIDIATHAYDIYWGISDYLGDKHSGLKRRSLWKARYGIFASPDYLARFGQPQTPQDLSGHQMIGHPHDPSGPLLMVNHQAHSQQQNLEWVELEAPVKTVSGQSKLAVQGLGLINALEDNHDIKAYLASDELVPVLADYWYQHSEIYIYYQQVKLEQAKVRAFIDFFLSKRHLW